MSIWRITLPGLVLAAGVAGTVLLATLREPAATEPPRVLPPLVEVLELHAVDVELRVVTHGTVRPRTESDLIAEVAGKVVEISSSLADGGFFERGDVLVRIDPRDHELSVIRARERGAQAEYAFQLEEAEAEAARAEWRELSPDKSPTPLAAREPQLRMAAAAVAAAKAELEIAERDLERATVRAPFGGRVRDKLVDVGQFVVRGTRIARIYAVDWAEVRLPLADADLAFLELPLTYRGESEGRSDGPEVHLHADFAGGSHTWQGRIVRTDGALDPKSRMVHAIARIEDPYGQASAGRPPLLVGMFVRAEVVGRQVRGVFALPRGALHGRDRVLVVDPDGRLHTRTVSVLRAERDRVLVDGGLAPGERICTTPLEAVADGMAVRVAQAEPTPEPMPEPAPPEDGK